MANRVVRGLRRQLVQRRVARMYLALASLREEPVTVAELANRFGLFKTIGWQIDTWAISEGFATEQIFWDDMKTPIMTGISRR